MAKPGDLAPDFKLKAADGGEVALSDLRGKVVVLFFYPKDETPGCIAEACAFRDQYEAFVEAGAEVVGISSDPPESHRRFAANHRLSFPLLSDVDGGVRSQYGVAKTLGLIPGRATYVIDRDGIIRHVFASQFQPTKHVREALRGMGLAGGEAS